MCTRLWPIADCINVCHRSCHSYRYVRRIRFHKARQLGSWDPDIMMTEFCIIPSFWPLKGNTRLWSIIDCINVCHKLCHQYWYQSNLACAQNWTGTNMYHGIVTSWWLSFVSYLWFWPWEDAICMILLWKHAKGMKNNWIICQFYWYARSSKKDCKICKYQSSSKGAPCSFSRWRSRKGN